MITANPRGDSETPSEWFSDNESEGPDTTPFNLAKIKQALVGVLHQNQNTPRSPFRMAELSENNLLLQGDVKHLILGAPKVVFLNPANRAMRHVGGVAKALSDRVGSGFQIHSDTQATAEEKKPAANGSTFFP